MTASSASASAPSPVPFAIARSMLSFGIEASRAFCTASDSAGLPSMSPPPSLAATVIARASLVNSLPRRESTIAFLCLIPAHLECPAMTLQSTHERADQGSGTGLPMPAYQGRREADVAAPPEACFAALTDYASMPEWQRALKNCRVIEHGDGQDVVEYEVDAKV